MILEYEDLAGRSGHEAGLALLEKLYRRQFGAALPPIAHTSRGKPYFPGNECHFSISHTPDKVFCCLSRQNIGIDAESCSRPVSPRLTQRFFSPNEQQRLVAAADAHAAALRLWVLKEAYAKLTGRGLGDYLKDTDFDPDDPRVTVLSGCYVAVLEEK